MKFMRTTPWGFQLSSWRGQQLPHYVFTKLYCHSRILVKRKEHRQFIAKWPIIYCKPTPHIILSPKWTLRSYTVSSSWIRRQQRMRKPFGIGHSAAVVFTISTSLGEYLPRCSLHWVGPVGLHMGSWRKMLWSTTCSFFDGFDQLAMPLVLVEPLATHSQPKNCLENSIDRSSKSSQRRPP